MSYVGKVKDTAGNTHLVGSTLYGVCATPAGTAAKAVTCTNFDKLETGVTIHVKFTYGNDSAATLNVNSTGAKNVYCAGTTPPKWGANSIVSFTYDGTQWLQNDWLPDNDTTYETFGENVDGLVPSSAAPSGTYAGANLYLTPNASWAPLDADSILLGESIAAEGNWASDQDLSGYLLQMEEDIEAASTDTKNTAGIDSSTSKVYLIGSATAPTSGTNGYARTYANSNVYMSNGTLSCSNINTGNGAYEIREAAGKSVDTSITSGSSSTNLPTAKAVADYVDSAVSTATSGALSYHGVATALTDITDTNYKKGWYWMVGTNPSITIDGVTCEAGDMIIAQQNKTATADNDLDVVQANIEALTNAEIDAIWAAA